jgi:hypothetical protein
MKFLNVRKQIDQCQHEVAQIVQYFEPLKKISLAVCDYLLDSVIVQEFVFFKWTSERESNFDPQNERDARCIIKDP